MRRPPLLTLLLAALAALAGRARRTPSFFAGDAIDGPSADIRSLGDLDLARDGTGALAYVKRVDGVDHVFAARFEGGVFQPRRAPRRGARRRRARSPSSAPPTAAGSSSCSSAAASSTASCGPPAAAWSAPTPLGAGSDPAVDLSINGTAYASFTAGRRRARRAPGPPDERVGPASSSPPTSIPARAAGVGGGRSRVAISADGIGVVTWGEAGHVYARKMFGSALSSRPAGPHAGDVRGSRRGRLRPARHRRRGRLELRLGRLSPALRRRRHADPRAPPARDELRPAGRGRRARRRAGRRAADRPQRPRRRGRGDDRHAERPADAGDHRPRPVRRRRAPVRPERRGAGRRAGDRREQRRPDRRGARRAPASRRTSACARSRTASSGPSARCRARSSARSRRSSASTSPPTAPSGAVVAWVQGGAEDRRIVAGYLDRPPGFFAGYTSQRCCQRPLPRLSWQPSFNLWGPVRYVVSVDGKPVGETTDTALQLDGAARRGRRTAGRSHAVDARGQSKRARTRSVRDRRARAARSASATSASGAS